MTFLRWLLLLASVLGYRAWFAEGPPLTAIHLDYDLVVIALVGLYRGQRVGAGMGWLIGFLCYSLEPDTMAWGGLLGALMGWLVGHWRERLFLEQLFYRWLIFALAIIGYMLLHYVLIVRDSFFVLPTLFVTRMLPGALVDATAAVLLGMVWERAVKTRPSDSDSAPAGEIV
jgi:cell shape-determining protein MreD